MHRNIWYPFTIIEDAPEPLKVKRGDGLWLELEDGRRIKDCISSWWVNLHGHAHPKIADAISKQAAKLEQVIFANFSHDPAEELAEKLTQQLPGSLNRVFFSDDGSTAVEVGMKMAYQYWKNRDQDRKTFICFEGAYHGDTFGAMSAGDRSVFTEVFKDLLFDVEFVPYPSTWIGDEERTEKESAVINQIEELLQQNPEKYAGIMIEPLVQGAGGMNMCSKEFLQELHWVNRQFNTLLIFDEVMTGFGRTGDWFASKRAQVEPDIICLAKGLTGGFLPLSVTVCSDRIYEAFNSSDPIKTFWHGHSYTANPIGCAAALASMDLMHENEPVFTGMENKHLKHFEDLKSHPKLKKLRVTGTIAAMDIEAEGEEGYLNPIARHIKEQCVEKGLLLRPLGNVLYLMPPYCTNESELADMYDGMVGLIDEVA
ncbi:MAG: adenosylmethionine--8-amino-7-oxononanoate transaminase [Candidatus Halalkalibacterium sp. M3_1C_030]